MAKGRLAFILFVLFAAFFALIGRVTYLKVVYGEEYETAARTQQISGYDDTINPNRGTITDRNHQPLAVSTTVYNIVLDVRVLVQNKMEEQEKTLHALCEAIPDLDYDTLKGYTALVDEEKKIPVLDTSWKVLAKQQSVEVKEALEAQDLKGVVYQKDTKRSYPAGKLAASVIGFERGDARLGLEEEYNQQMTGIPGRSYITYDGANGAVSQEVPAQDGNTIITTLDYNMQTFAEQAVEEMMADYNPENAASIIMDPNTGEILAEASYPGYDLNDPWDLSSIYTEKEIAGMNEEERLDALNSMWRNFCVSDAYEPGSTIKPFTVAAGLETGTLTGDEEYYCEGSLKVADYTIRCSRHEGHGAETTQDALAYSCNVALMEMAEKIGADNFSRYQHIFGFGEYTGIDLPGEAATEALLYTADNMGEVELATNSFGQGFNVTMTQMAAAFSSLINGGYYYEPHVVKQIQDESGNVIETKDPVLLRKTISAETSEQLKEYLGAVMDYGTGKGAQVEGYDIGAKTGTAEKLPRGNGKYLLSYMGFAPQNNPEVLIYVVVDEPNTAAQDDSSLVRKLAKSIMEEAFPYLGITTIEESEAEAAEAAAAQSGISDDEEYTDYNQDYEDTYDKPDGEYIDENYSPDLDDWTGGD